jgi:hypothetical protein
MMATMAALAGFPPELGRLDHAQAASLAGLAPVARDKRPDPGQAIHGRVAALQRAFLKSALLMTGYGARLQLAPSAQTQSALAHLFDGEAARRQRLQDCLGRD